MATHSPDFELRLARGEDDIRAGQRLRYEVFVEELGADGANVDHAERLERDAFDPRVDHLLLFDRARPGAPAVGVYRLLRDDMLAAGEEFYSAGEYDLSALTGSGRRLLELGRSCVHADYRGGAALMQLWQWIEGSDSAMRASRTVCRTASCGVARQPGQAAPEGGRSWAVTIPP